MKRRLERKQVNEYNVFLEEEKIGFVYGFSLLGVFKWAALLADGEVVPGPFSSKEEAGDAVEVAWYRQKKS
ncbi:MAG: hypothetical protein WC662_01780 [Candidatus Paceibacterota bacterium]|jgi:hypothetical protein